MRSIYKSLKYPYFILVVSLLIQCQQYRSSNVEMLHQDINIIKELNNSIIDHLPSSFEENLDLYGSKEFQFNYEDDIVLYLYNTPFVCKEQLLCKLILISFNGTWEPDYAASLQYVVRRLLIEYPKISVNALNNYNEVKNKSFWNFVFSGLYPQNSLEYFYNLQKVFRNNGYKYMYLLTSSYNDWLKQQEQITS